MAAERSRPSRGRSFSGNETHARGRDQAFRRENHTARSTSRESTFPAELRHLIKAVVKASRGNTYVCFKRERSSSVAQMSPDAGDPVTLEVQVSS